MRVLLDENLDWRLVRYFDAEFQVTTVSRQAWKGKRNSELLRQSEAWNEVAIFSRAKDLADRASKIWIFPKYRTFL